MKCDAWVVTVSWESFQLPVAHSWGLLNHLNSFCRGMFKFKTKLDADSLLYSLSHFDATATQYTCSLNCVYRPHWLVQWGCHCSRVCIPLHWPWLPGYIDVAQTVLVMLTMIELFADRLHIHTHTYIWGCVRDFFKSATSRVCFSGFSKQSAQFPILSLFLSVDTVSETWCSL